MKKASISLKLVLIATLCLISQFISTLTVSASVEHNPWAVERGLSFGEPEKRESKERCTDKTVTIVGRGLLTQDKKMCIYERPTWRYARDANGIVVGIGMDKNMYALSSLHTMQIGEIIDVPYSNNLHFKTRENNPRKGMNVIENFPSKLRHVLAFGGARTYELTDNSIQPFITSQTMYVNAVGVSDNGRWMAIADGSNGFVLRNMETGQLQWFSDYRYGTGLGSNISFVVSNDGSTVAINDPGSNTKYRVHTLTPSCGVVRYVYHDDVTTQLEQNGVCPDDNGELWLAADHYFGSDWTKVEISRMSYDNSTLYFRGDSSVFAKYGDNEYPLYTSALPVSPQLDYLALGDSYASGEGDTIRNLWQNYYRQGTDEAGPPMERCHISTRSYPYLLAAKHDLQKESWDTVACSGAHVREDYHGDESIYLGQNGRLDVIEVPDERILYKDEALNSFIPGRIKQLEFIKKYQPKVITISGSGNDVNFEGVLRACVQLAYSADCMYAGSHGATMLGLGIEAQYETVRKLVDEIKRASPDTSIYYIGYPQFVSGRQACTHFSGLSQNERTLFRAATTYLNSIIKAASESRGAIYVDIENAFESQLMDRTLCNPAPLYVNNFTLGCASNDILKWIGGSLDCEESYHPNHLGHEAIADRVAATHPNLMTNQPCVVASACIKEVYKEDVPIPDFFVQAYADDAAANYTPVPGNGGILVVQKANSTGAIRQTISSVQPYSEARTYLTSEPTELGSVYADATGTLTIDAPVPENIAAGYHTLHVETQSFSGEPIKFWWIVLVLGRDGDIDEDGVADGTDKCAFTSELGRDLDQDGVDDGCDQYVSPINHNSNISEEVTTPVSEKVARGRTPGSNDENLYITSTSAVTDRLPSIQDQDSKVSSPILSTISHTPTTSSGDGKDNTLALIAISALVTILLMLKLGRIYDWKRKQ